MVISKLAGVKKREKLQWAGGLPAHCVDPCVRVARTHGLRAVNTTFDTSLLRLIVLLYCLRLRVSSPTQIFDLLGGVSRS